MDIRTKKKFRLLPIFIFMVWLSAAVLPASAATIAVTSAGDSGNDSPITLDGSD